MFAEVAAYAASQGKTLVELLDDIYAEFGYFLESNHSKTFEGAEGAAKIQKLADSYANQPPTEFDGSPVIRTVDYSKGGHLDEEGDTIPKEKMLWVFTADGRAFAVRPSGTEPKIKYYLYGRQQPSRWQVHCRRTLRRQGEGQQQPEDALERHREGHRRPPRLVLAVNSLIISGVLLALLVERLFCFTAVSGFQRPAPRETQDLSSARTRPPQA